MTQTANISISTPVANLMHHPIFALIRSDEPANNSMDISTGHMVLAYMEDHLKNKQRLEQEWVALCGYEAEPSSTTVAFKVGI